MENLVNKLTIFKKEDSYKQMSIRVLPSVYTISDSFESNIMWKQPLHMNESIRLSVS
jgi:hypothetical protein